MFEKFRVIFTIPELRQKIFLTLLFLAIYRVGWQIPLPVVNQEAMTAHFRVGRVGRSIRGSLCIQREPTESSHYFWSWHHAVYICFDYLPTSRQRLETFGRAEKRGRKRPEENQ